MRLLTVREAASYLKLNEFTVYRLARSGRIPSARIGGSIRFQKEAIDRWLDSQVRQERPAILIVDDDPGVRESLAEVARREGHKAVAVATGEEALAALGNEPFALIFLDIMLPGMSGVETLRKIKALSSDTPVAVVTAYSESQLAVEALSLGPIVLVSKPYQVEDIRRVLSMIAGTRALPGRRGMGC